MQEGALSVHTGVVAGAGRLVSRCADDAAAASAVLSEVFDQLGEAGGHAALRATAGDCGARWRSAGQQWAQAGAELGDALTAAAAAYAQVEHQVVRRVGGPQP